MWLHSWGNFSNVSKIYPIWTFFIKSEEVLEVLSNVTDFDPICTILIQFWRVWYPIWKNLITNLEKFDIQFGEFWSNLNNFHHFWTSLIWFRDLGYLAYNDIQRLKISRRLWEYEKKNYLVRKLGLCPIVNLLSPILKKC